MPDFTVVIPTIGRDSVRRAVESVATQSVGADAIVVLDRPELKHDVERLLQGLSYRLVVTPGAAGGAAARNAGLDAVETQYVAFLDDDDWYDPRFLESRERFLIRGHNLVLGNFVHVYPNGLKVDVPSSLPKNFDPSSLADYTLKRDRLRFGKNAVQTSSFVLASDLARDVRWDASLRKHQDWDFVLRSSLHESANLSWDPAPRVFVSKDSAESISRRMDSDASSEFLQRYAALMSKRTAADFTFVHIVRARAHNGELLNALKTMGSINALPHFAAMIVGIAGALKR